MKYAFLTSYNPCLSSLQNKVYWSSGCFLFDLMMFMQPIIKRIEMGNALKMI